MRAFDHPARAVVLLSGGVDSATTLAIAHADGKELYAISFDYGQRHLRELESAKIVAEFFGVKKHLIVNFNLRDIGGSALTSEIAVPKAGVSAINAGPIPNPQSPTPGSQSPIPVTYVPARNTIFLSFALAWAEVIEAEHIYIGATAVDYSGYPDCRPEYLESFERTANLATRASVEGRLAFSIHAPLLLMSKAEIIKTGLCLGLDYSLTWSCYDPQPANAGVQSSKFKVQSYKEENSELKTPNSQLRALHVPCGLCDSCRFREKGFREAGIKDPLYAPRTISAEK
ncbi:MAG: 7-cyano-7-deazaguanine synthase QueC [Nitrospira bacterium HGW-Nitrospira-1]|nr:MAG: 7-cyano-7-deazaguanine synthase QueC [Nitrospira bacterium HGW-Nitrospira-1]